MEGLSIKQGGKECFSFTDIASTWQMSACSMVAGLVGLCKASPLSVSVESELL